MATLTVLKFETADGAASMATLLSEFQSQHLITVEDAAAISWPAGAGRPQSSQIPQLGAGALDSPFWGLLFGLVLFVPFPGMPDRVAMDMLGGVFSDFGIDRQFIRQIHHDLTEGSSALFLFTRHPVTERIAALVHDRHMACQIAVAHLPSDQADRMRKIFAAPAVYPARQTTSPAFERSAVQNG